MGNVLPTDRRLHRKYDLKGSTWRRTIGPERRAADAHATLKDQDLDMQVGAGHDWDIVKGDSQAGRQAKVDV